MNCLWVGDEQAYANYERLGRDKKIGDQKLASAISFAAVAFDGLRWPRP